INFDEDILAPVEATEGLVSKLNPRARTKTVLTADETGHKTDHFTWLKSPKLTAETAAHWLLKNDQ
ncbi:MAG: hypothetical protein AAF197_07900, partial [Pseudomonadota bacterium]